MLAKRIVACLDVLDGRIVKGRKFLALRDAGDPAERAAYYCSEGVDELVMLDVSATQEGRLACRATVERLARAIDVPLTVGGGVRSIGDFERLLDAGADKIALNSRAVDSPELLTEAARRYGSQCVVVSIDVRSRADGFEVATHGGMRQRAVDALEWMARAEDLGAGEILLTSIDRDGSCEGFDLALIERASARVNVPVIASGGARDENSFAEVLAAGADAALGASVFHYDRVSVAAIKRRCRGRGLEVRDDRR